MIHTLSVIFPLRTACQPGSPAGRRRLAGSMPLPLAANLARPETKFTWNFDLLEKHRAGMRRGASFGSPAGLGVGWHTA
ncbi:hypothetical protein, partial [Mesorhizobium sp.]